MSTGSGESTADQILVGYLDPHQQPGTAVIWILPETVEVHAAGRLAAVLDREALVEWLAVPLTRDEPKPLEVGAVTLSRDFEGRLVVYLPDVPTWVRPGDAEWQLRAALL